MIIIVGTTKRQQMRKRNQSVMHLKNDCCRSDVISFSDPPHYIKSFVSCVYFDIIHLLSYTQADTRTHTENAENEGRKKMIIRNSFFCDLPMMNSVATTLHTDKVYKPLPMQNLSSPRTKPFRRISLNRARLSECEQQQSTANNAFGK